MTDTTTATTTDLIFEDPPHRADTIGGWLQSLRAHPGRWVRYPRTVNAGSVATIRQGRYRGIAAGEFDATSVKAEGSQIHLYARYVGGGDS